MAKGLTNRQQLILEYILDYVRKEGYPPSIREIGRDFKIGSLRGVTVHLDALERKGYIQRSNTPRSIKIIHPSFQQSNEVVMLPLLGSIAAGEPDMTQENVEYHLPVPSQMVRNAKNAYLLRINGESMIGDGIMHNDIVVVKPQETGEDGDLVAVVMGDGATVKRLNKKGAIVKLMPSNPKFEPIDVKQENAWVVGKVLGLFRDFEGRAF